MIKVATLLAPVEGCESKSAGRLPRNHIYPDDWTREAHVLPRSYGWGSPTPPCLRHTRETKVVGSPNPPYCHISDVPGDILDEDKSSMLHPPPRSRVQVETAGCLFLVWHMLQMFLHARAWGAASRHQISLRELRNFTTMPPLYSSLF